jgi:predicted anti-sigma-YlaC factor YlaD
MSDAACDIQQFRIQEALDGVLGASEDTALAEHLRGCAHCCEYRASLLATTTRLSQALQAPVASPDLVFAVENVVRPALGLTVRRPRRSWVPAWGVAAACVFAAVGLATPRFHGVSVAPVVAASPTQVDTASAATSTADAEDGRAILTWFGPEVDAETEE